MNFKHLRTNARITQTELALKLGIDQTTVSKWEVGDSAPKLKMISDISKILNVSTETVLQCFTAKETDNEQ